MKPGYPVDCQGSKGHPVTGETFVEDGNDIDCRIDGIGAMLLKSEYVKKE